MIFLPTGLPYMSRGTRPRLCRRHESCLEQYNNETPSEAQETPELTANNARHNINELV